MKTLFLTLIFTFTAYLSHAQRTTIYQSSFRNWSLSDGWQIIDNDASAGAAGMIANSITVSNPAGQTSTEIMDYMLGLKGFSGSLNQLLVSPEMQLGANPWMQCYSYKNLVANTTSISLWVLPDPNNVSMSGVTDSIQVLSTEGFNSVSLAAYANTTVRIAFKFSGIASTANLTAYIDDLHLFNKDRLAYVEDAAFRNYLQSAIPAAFAGDSLNYTSNVAVNLRRINANNLGIASIEGLQYFPDLRKFSANNNQIQSFPVDRIPRLDTLMVSYNLITALPDMPIAKTLYFDHNLITNFPDYFNMQIGKLYANNNLIYGCLECSNRFVNGSIMDNVAVYAPCTYYNLLRPSPGVPMNTVPCITQMSKVRGRVYYDINENGFRDPSEPSFPNQTISFFQSTDMFTNAAGEYQLVTQAGPVQMNVTNIPSYFTCTTPLDTVLQAGDIMSHDFRIIAVSQANDLKVNIIRNSQYATSGWVSAAIFAKNLGTTPVNAVVKLPLPNGVSLASSEFGTVMNDTLIWNVVVNPLETVDNYLFLSADSPLDYQVTELRACGTIENDVNLSDNCSSAYFYKVPTPAAVPPYDPNYKIVSTPIVDTNFHGDLYYTIRFENIGGGNATYVAVRDQLSALLDPTTFEFLGSTHPVAVSYAGTDQLIQFTFNNITLTPKSVDSTQSFGFIWFKIKPKNPMLLHDTIKNSASIIFNTEVPIVTEKAIVYVDPLRVAKNTIPDQAHYCLGDTLIINDQSNAYPTGWSWSSDLDPQFHAVTSQVTLPLNSPGTFTIKQITRWETGFTDTLIKTIVVGNPEVEIAAIPVLCSVNQQVVLNQGSPSGGTYTGTGIANNILNATLLPAGTNTLTYSYTDAYGCEASDTAVFEVQGAYMHTIPQEICSGESFTWEGTAYTTSGTYTMNYTRQSGCDSTLYLDLLVKNEIQVFDTLGLCDGNTIQWENISLSAAGDYESAAVSINGCDSTNYLHLNVYPLFSFEDGTATICSGAGMNWQGQYLSLPGTYEVNYISQFGCDSSFHLQLIVAPLFEDHDTISTCDGNTVQWQSMALSAAGDYESAAVSINGCDSTYYLHLDVHPQFDFNDAAITCDGNGISWQGQYLDMAGTYEAHYTSVFGCDSSYHIQLIVAPLFEDHDTISTCEGSTILWQNTALSETGDYESAALSINGCDSTHYLHLDVHPLYSFSNELTICKGTGTNWHDQYIETAGSYETHYLSQFGCDSSYFMQLSHFEVLEPLSVTGTSLSTVPEMDSYSWLNCTSNSLVPNETEQTFVFTENGTYAAIVSANGCIDTTACYVIDFLGIETYDDLGGLSVYPNPFESTLIIEGSTAGSFNYSLYTLLGQELHSGIVEDKLTIETGEMVPGMYFLKVSSGEAQRIFKLEHLQK